MLQSRSNNGRCRLRRFSAGVIFVGIAVVAVVVDGFHQSAGVPFHRRSGSVHVRSEAYHGSASLHSSSMPSSPTALFMADKVEEFRRGMGSAGINGNEDEADDDDNDMRDVVMKFGGSSLANHDRVDYVAKLIQSQLTEQGYRPRAVVCSAMGKTTNNLLNAGEAALVDGFVNIDELRQLHTATMDEFKFDNATASTTTRQEVETLLNECEQLLNGVRLIQELSPKSLDQLVSYGERCSVRIMAARLNQIGVKAEAFDAWDVGIFTDDNFGDARLAPGYESHVRKAFNRIDKDTVAVVTGFIGHDPDGRITTLGRGGSDLTATALGASLGVHEIQTWKDVDGILSCDPNMIAAAKPVDQVSYEEASELAYFGAQVLHPIAMQPAMKYDIPVRVKNSYNPNAKGTKIGKQVQRDAQQLVTAITYKRNVNVLDITSTQMLGAYGFLSRVFSLFEKHKLSVDVLASSEVSISLTLDKKQDVIKIDNLVDDLKECAQITRKGDRSIITLIADVNQSSRVLAIVFQVFAVEDINVEMMSQGASKVNISFIVKNSQLEQAIQSLHKCFFEGNCVVNMDDILKSASPAEAA